MTATRRQRDVADSADEKWQYAAHTEAKHEILRRYLGTWLSILGQHHPRVLLLDGFAVEGGT